MKLPVPSLSCLSLLGLALTVAGCIAPPKLESKEAAPATAAGSSGHESQGA